MTSYLFAFGRTPLLAFAELASLFPDATPLTAQIGMLDVPSGVRFLPESVIALLGGTVKIAHVLQEVSTLSAAVLASQLVNAAGPSKRIVFGISSYIPGVSTTTKLLSETKQALESRGYAARFVSSRDNEPLSSVVVSKQNVTELIIAPKKRAIMIAKTAAVQKFEAWNRRDYGRPYADPKSGMLPPKVARMAVNLALRGVAPQGKPCVLLDPFCGMGTILAEGLLAGWNAIGSDQSAEAVEKARKNLEWLEKNGFRVKPGMTEERRKLFVSDATHVSEHLPKASVDAIVTEPFMGPTEIGGRRSGDGDRKAGGTEKIKNIIRGLENLYIGCLKDWYRVLKPGGRVVMALPAFQIGGRTMFVKRVIDSCENLGYTKLLGPLEYSRPQAVVKREFYVWHT